ncbi:MAG: acylphosphatase [Syntrophales bacterium]|nr:acylphosphatase [Syntrophales bacterium]MDD5232483.1 acylphosphatase [Syntrophales bacterium]MDD5531600.1 acylphosphatase [Syntrophales bacterium]
MDNQNRRKRVKITISGRVQGVSFRAWTKRTAESMELTGWVRNLHNGDVEAVFEGPEDKVREMVEWCRKGPRLADVTGIQISEEAWRGEFRNFSIRF